MVPEQPTDIMRGARRWFAYLHELLARPLPPFNSVRCCPKCGRYPGGRRHLMQYCGVGRPRMVRTCSRCFYSWDEACPALNQPEGGGA